MPTIRKVFLFSVNSVRLYEYELTYIALLEDSRFFVCCGKHNSIFRHIFMPIFHVVALQALDSRDHINCHRNWPRSLVPTRCLVMKSLSAFGPSSMHATCMIQRTNSLPFVTVNYRRSWASSDSEHLL